MKKLFELTTKDFLSGVSQLSHGIGNRLFFSAKGISPIVDPYAGSNDFGLLQTSSAPISMTGAVVVDSVIAWATQITAANTGYLYGLGDDGNFYVIVLSAGGSQFSITNERSGANVIPNSANGLVIYGGFLYYSQKTQIGQATEGTAPFDTSSTWDNDWSVTTAAAGALTSSIYHPLHVFSARMWIANDSTLDVVSGGATPVYTEDVLTLESDYKIRCLNNDGQFLVLGATQNLGDVTLMGKSKIVFWDTYSVYPNKEWEFPESNIVAILKGDEGWMYAIGGRGVYRFSYSTPPQAILHSLTTTEAISYGRCFAADNFIGNTVIWGGGHILMYGSAMAGYPPATLHPFTGLTAGQNVVSLTAQAYTGLIFFSSSDDKLYRQSITDGGATSLSATTNFIPLKEKTKIEAIKFILGTDLATGDSLNVDVSTDSGDTATDWGTMAFTTQGAVRRITLSNTFDAEELQMVLNFNGGNVKIKKIEVWGSPYPMAIK